MIITSVPGSDLPEHDTRETSNPSVTRTTKARSTTAHVGTAAPGCPFVPKGRGVLCFPVHRASITCSPGTSDEWRSRFSNCVS